MEVVSHSLYWWDTDKPKVPERIEATSLEDSGKEMKKNKATAIEALLKWEADSFVFGGCGAYRCTASRQME
jgi:hypothetical protein